MTSTEPQRGEGDVNVLFFELAQVIKPGSVHRPAPMPKFKEAADEAERLATAPHGDLDKSAALFAAKPVVVPTTHDPYDVDVDQQWVCWSCADRGIVRRFVKNHVPGSSLATIRGLDQPFFLKGSLRQLYLWIEQHNHEGPIRVD